jgi:hypothetical protein
LFSSILQACAALLSKHGPRRVIASLAPWHAWHEDDGCEAVRNTNGGHRINASHYIAGDGLRPANDRVQTGDKRAALS